MDVFCSLLIVSIVLNTLSKVVFFGMGNGLKWVGGKLLFRFPKKKAVVETSL